MGSWAHYQGKRCLVRVQILLSNYAGSFQQAVPRAGPRPIMPSRLGLTMSCNEEAASPAVLNGRGRGCASRLLAIA
eukprot:3068976-Pyramimonas_sp.AAC.1